MEIPLIKMEDIHKWFDRTYALRGVNFEIYKGEVVGLIGSNGAGKSTLIKILSGVFPPSKGRIFYHDEEVEIKTPKDAIDLGIETVHQDYSLVGERNVAQNIFLGRELVRSAGFIKVLDTQKMEEVASQKVRELGLNISSPTQEVRFLSGGERQGIAIARAMLFKATLVILDEPTTALSVKGCRQVLDFISQLKKNDIACIFIDHNIGRIFPLADRFVVMSHGQIIENVLREDTSVEEIEELLVSC